MPIVGNKKYPYTKVGIKKAKKHAETTGQKMVKKYKSGGAIIKAKGGKWIQDAIKKPGALRSSLGIKKGKTIPAKTLDKAAKSKGKLGQRARLAETLKTFS